MDRDDRNHPSKQGCPPQGGIRRKPMTKSRTRRTETGYEAIAVLGHPARDGEARWSFGILRGRSGGSARRRQALPEEISVLVRSHRTTAPAMARDRGGEVSRSHSSHDGRRAESSNAGSRRRGFDDSMDRKQR